MNRAIVAIGAAVLLAIALGIGYAVFGGPSAGDAGAPIEAPKAPADVTPEAGGPAPETGGATNTPEPERRPAHPVVSRTPEQSMAEFPQGLHGRVVDPRDRPLANVRVFLLESALNDPVTLPVLRQQGLLMGPIAETRSTADGRFALGLRLATDRLHELRLLAPALADTRLGNLRVLANEWHDLGTIVMAPGTTVTGTVTAEGTNTPIPGASVVVEAGSAFADAMLRSIPGREDGLRALTGIDGRYEIANAPARGAVRISAVAQGFARVIETDVDLSDRPNVEVHFRLPPGSVLRGIVVAEDGKPVRNARLEAWPEDRGVDPCVSHSHADGSFAVLGLRAQPHRLRVIARGFVRAELPDVAVDARGVRIELSPLAVVAVRATTPNGRVLRDYRVGLRRWFPPRGAVGEQIGRIVEIPDQRVRLGRMHERFELNAPGNGSFVVQILADDWAKTLSQPITIDDETRRAEVDVEVVPGATLRGRVVDDRLRPLAGATVTTQFDGSRPDNPVQRLLTSAIPDRITARTVVTDANGSFVLPRLAYGSYQLQIDHEQCCRHYVRSLHLDASTTQDLGAIRLVSGAVIHGRATASGRVLAQARVVLSGVLAEGATESEAHDLARLETVTDSTGAFTMPRRVPPGDYELKAAGVGIQDPEVQVFEVLRQFQRSAVRLTVNPGQTRVEQHIDIPEQGP